MVKKKGEIVIIYRSWQRFHQTVFDMLSEKYNVKKFEFRGIFTPFKLLKKINKHNLSVSMFAGKHAFCTVLLGKIIGHKSVVVVLGYDVAKSQHSCELTWRIVKTMTKITLTFADCCIAASKYLMNETLSFVKPKKLIYTPAPDSVDTAYFVPQKKEKKLVLSVGIITKLSLERKRFDVFRECAKKMPDVSFVWAGLLKESDILDTLIKQSPPNLTILHDLSDEDLRTLMGRANVYCQLSRSETFGVAMAEAMACECVPVVTPVGAIPEVVGDAGIYVPYGDVEKTVEGIKEALSKPELGKKARQRIVENYSKEKLKPEFLKIIDEIYSELENRP
ncbi:MAG: glycosyltransferase [Thermoplasmata archaeon]